VGCFLVAYPDYTAKMLVIMVGLLFFIPGLVSIVLAFARPKVAEGQEYERKAFPIVGIGSSILGLVLIITPTVFIAIMMYILGVMLVTAGIYQIVEYKSFSKIMSASLWLYAIPVLVIMAGIFIFLNPIVSASLPFIVLGVSGIVYGVSEFVKFFVMKKAYSRLKKQDEARENTQVTDITYYDDISAE
jgi:uncharacterized membrane protein HdeD (DUF308 family)